jgi:virulence-associated protein VagC
MRKYGQGYAQEDYGAHSKGVRPRKEFRIRTKEVDIQRRGNEIVLRERFRGLEEVFYLLTEFVNAQAIKKLKRNDKPQQRKGL